MTSPLGGSAGSSPMWPRCSACRQELAELREVVAAIEATPVADPASGILARIFPGDAPEAGPGRPGGPGCTRLGQPPVVSAALSPGGAGPGGAAALCGGAAHGARRPHPEPGRGDATPAPRRGPGLESGSPPPRWLPSPRRLRRRWPRSPPHPPCRTDGTICHGRLWRKVRPCRWRKWIFPAGTWMRNWRE